MFLRKKLPFASGSVKLRRGIASNKNLSLNLYEAALTAFHRLNLFYFIVKIFQIDC